MVFSFFKKEPQKMVAKPAAVPRAPAAGAETPSPTNKQPVAPSEVAIQPASPAPTEVASGEISPLDYSDFVFSESSPQFVLEDDVDPVDAEAEEAAILFANAQDDAARSVLENAIRIHQFGPGERLWLMLFDLYRLTGRKAEFEALEIEFAQSFEKSPPIWRDKSKGGEIKRKEPVAGSLLFRGELTADNPVAFDAVFQALEKNPRLRLDMSKVSCLDAIGCGRMLQLMQQSRKSKRELELLGREGVFRLVEKQVEVGRAENADCWLLLLELCQLQGMHALFEEVAINYAVTFEVSPPSWDPGRVAAPEPVQRKSAAVDNAAAGEAYVLRGDVKASRFGDLPAYAGTHDPVLVDCSELTRMDFISAGALLNLLTTVRNSGKQTVFRHPNHLVAELFGVVGLKSIATIVFSNN